MPPARILITGGSGYLGQFLIQRLAEQFEVHYTYATRRLQCAPDSVTAWQVNLATGNGLEDAFSATPVAVINCAAISQPGLCQQNPDLARSVNVPKQVLACLVQQKEETGVEALLVHLSTDQVYDGSKAFWKEDDACEPINAYGHSKVEAETAIKASWQKHIILRSSIVYGPPPPDPVPRPLFLQFVEKALKEGTPTTFFDDEFRSPVYVNDIVRIVTHLITCQQLPAYHVFNMGGPERLSRLDMARKVAHARGYSTDAIVAAPSSSVQRPVASPADISMCCDRLVQELGIRLTPFGDAVQQFAPSC